MRRMFLSVMAPICLLGVHVEAASFTVNVTQDQWDANIGDGVCDVDLATAGDQCSIRAALNEFNANNNGPAVVDIVEIPPDTYVIDYPGEPLHITDDVIVKGTTGVPQDIDIAWGDNGYHIFDIKGEPETVVFDSIAIRDASHTPSGTVDIVFAGGAIRNFADGATNLVINNSHFHDNWAKSGGAINSEMNGANIVISNSYFKGCSAAIGTAASGGAINVIDMQYLLITDTTMYDNHAVVNGGAIRVTSTRSGAATQIYGGLYSGNTAGDNGGVLNLWSRILSVIDASFSNNHSGENGGAIYHRDWSEAAEVKGSDFLSNVAGEGGGAIWFENHYVTGIHNSHFANNRALGAQGGAIALVKIENAVIGAAVTGTSFIGNEANGSGGGLYATTYPGLYTEKNEFTQNHSDASGGAIYLSDPHSSLLSTNFVIDTSLSSNTSGVYGGGVYASGIDMHMARSIVEWNTAESGGGGIYSRATLFGSTSGNLSIFDSYIVSNTTDGDGGGVLLQGNAFEVQHSTVANNIVGSGVLVSNGGGFWIDSGFNPVVIQNTTVSGNNATGVGGGAFYRGFAAEITNSTIVDNSADSGGGLFLVDDIEVIDKYGNTIEQDSILRIGNTVIAENQVTASGIDCLGGDIWSRDHNLIGDIYLCPVSLLPNDLFGDSSFGAILDPDLGPLLFNGGLTPTHLPNFPTSALINSGPAACSDLVLGGILSRDQRDFNRNVGTCDRGAVELQIWEQVFENPNGP